MPTSNLPPAQRELMDRINDIRRELERMAAKEYGVAPLSALVLLDGITAPTAISGKAIIYVDVADGDLKVRFGDGTTKTLATDT